MNSTISIRKDSEAGRDLCAKAEYIGIDAGSLLLGICFNAMKRKSNPLLPTSASTPTPQPPQPPAPKPVPSTGIFDAA